MAILIANSNFASVWDRLLVTLMNTGKPAQPRGYDTLEKLNVSIEVFDGLSNILVNPVRSLNYRFMIAEWLWIQAGLNEVDVLARYNSVMTRFSDDGEILSGAYGPRLMPQMEYILKSLQERDSRQAVATIWTPNPADSKDIPCTISLQWLIRNGQVHCTANMRSSDVWLGLPYDFFTFSQLTNYIAFRVGLPVGSITMNLASSHIYSDHFDEAIKVIKSPPSEFIQSPKIPAFVNYPSARDLEFYLKYPEMVFDQSDIWRTYASALINNKTHALEVLRAISKNF